jgi:Uma2 family endonuclease
MSVAMEDWPRRHRISVDEYYRMAEVGLLAPDARVELIEGEIIDMPPIGYRHEAAVDRLAMLLHRAVGDLAIVRCQGSVQLGDFSAPQPDFVLLTRREDFYKQRRATAADTLLAIEVSDTTLRYDMQTKMSLYARYGIREFWVFDVENERFHVFRNPVGSGYAEVRVTDQPEVVALAALPQVSVDLSSLLGG